MLDRLIKFALLVDAGSYTKAAKQAHISQPALSMAIKQLEHELSNTLFVRANHEFQLTAAGKHAYRTGKMLQATVKNLRNDIATTGAQLREYRIGMMDSVAAATLAQPSVLPELQTFGMISLTVDTTSRLVQLLGQSELDVVVATETAQYDRTLIRSEELTSETLVCVTAAHNAQLYEQLAASGTLADIIAYNQASNTFRIISSHVRQAGFEPHILMYSTSPAVMLAIVLAGNGQAFLPQTMVQELLAQKQLVAITPEKLALRRPVMLYRSVYSTIPSLHDYLRTLVKDGLQ